MRLKRGDDGWKDFAISMDCTADHDHDSAWVCGPGMQVKFDLIQRDVERLMLAIGGLTAALKERP